MSTPQLQGRKVALFLAAAGTEQAELVQPRDAILAAGGTVHVVGEKPGTVQAVNHDLEPGDSFEVQHAFKDVSAKDYDALVIPGGSVGADKLRADPDAVALLQEFGKLGKPIAVICHGPWTLVEAGLAKGRTLTSFPSLQTDIRNAGGTWVDEEVVVDRGVITSRTPKDLPAFCAKLIEEIAKSPRA